MNCFVCQISEFSITFTVFFSTLFPGYCSFSIFWNVDTTLCLSLIFEDICLGVHIYLQNPLLDINKVALDWFSLWIISHWLIHRLKSAEHVFCFRSLIYLYFCLSSFPSMLVKKLFCLLMLKPDMIELVEECFLLLLYVVIVWQELCFRL